MMNKEYIIKLAQLINEYPILPIKTRVDVESISSDFDFCQCDFTDEPRIQWVCRSDDGLLVSNVRKDDGLEWEEAICVYLGSR